MSLFYSSTFIVALSIFFPRISADLNFPPSSPISAIIQDEPQLVQVKIVETRSAKTPYQVELTAFDQPIQLNLERPVCSIFSDGFTFGTSTIHKENLVLMEKSIFVDFTTKSAVSLDLTKGMMRIQGFVNGLSIFYDGEGRHFVARQREEKASFVNDVPETQDTIPNHIQNQNSGTKKLQATDTAKLEVVAVMDQPLAALCGHNEENITRYVAIMMHAVNIIYGDMDNPSLTIKLAGIRVLTPEEHDAIVEATGHKIHDMLYALRDWVNSGPPGVGPCDVVAMLTGVIVLSPDGTPSIAGVAFRPGTCGGYKVSVTRDTEAYWGGVFTLAHEMAHNMGCRHDFDTSCGSEGFIMDYNRGTPNAYHFSECSKQAIRERISIPDGSCLLTEDAVTGVHLGDADPGDFMSFEDQCFKRIVEGSFGEYIGYFLVDNPVETVCVNLRCRYKKEDGSTWIVTFKFPAEGTSCNQSGGKCRSGYCV